MLWSSVYSYFSDTKHPSETRGPAAVAGAPSQTRPRSSSTRPLPCPCYGGPQPQPLLLRRISNTARRVWLLIIWHIRRCERRCLEKASRVKQTANIWPPKPEPSTQASVGWGGGWPRESDQLCSQAVRGPAQPPNSWPWPWALGTWLPQLQRVL